MVIYMRKNEIKRFLYLVLALVIGLSLPVSCDRVYAKTLLQVSENVEIGSSQITQSYAYNQDLPNYVVGKWITNPGSMIFDSEEEADAYAWAAYNKEIIPNVGELATQLDYDRGWLKSQSQIGTYKSYRDSFDKKFVTFSTYDEAITAYERHNYVKEQSKVIKTQLAGLFGYTYSGNPTLLDSSEYLDPENVTYDVMTFDGKSMYTLSFLDYSVSYASVFADNTNNNYSDSKKFKDIFGYEFEKCTTEEIAASEAGKTFYVKAKIIDNWHSGGWYTDGDWHFEEYGPFSTITEAMQKALVCNYNQNYYGGHILHGYYYQEYGDDILVNTIYELYCLGYDITQLPGYIG